MQYHIQKKIFDGTYDVYYNSVINPEQNLMFTTDNNDEDFLKEEVLRYQLSVIKSYLSGLSKNRRTAHDLYFPGKSQKFDVIDNNIKNNFLDIACERLKEYTKSPTSLRTLDRISDFLKKN